MFISSSGTPIRNGQKIKWSSDFILFPSEVAVIKIEAHTKNKDEQKLPFFLEASDLLFLDSLNIYSWKSFNFHLVWTSYCIYVFFFFLEGYKSFLSAVLMLS